MPNKELNRRRIGVDVGHIVLLDLDGWRRRRGSYNIGVPWRNGRIEADSAIECTGSVDCGMSEVQREVSVLRQDRHGLPSGWIVRVEVGQNRRCGDTVLPRGERYATKIENAWLDRVVLDGQVS